MSTTTKIKAELLLSEIYFKTLEEFSSIKLDLKFETFSIANYMALIEAIEGAARIDGIASNNSDDSNTQPRKQQALYELLMRGNDFIITAKKSLPILNSDLIEVVDDYLSVDPSYVQSINIDLLKRPFDLLKVKQYKKYISRKKEEIFLKLINQIFQKQAHGWRSVSSVVNDTYDQYTAEFRKFDIEWLENEISQKEKYLPEIENSFKNKVQVWNVVSKLKKNKGLLLESSFETTQDENTIKTETNKTTEEIALLKQLVHSLKGTRHEQALLKKYLPYYGDGDETLLRKLLSRNKELLNLIIEK